MPPSGFYVPCGIAVNFLNGTPRQRQLFNDAVAEALYDWSRIPNNIDVDWESQFDSTLHNSFALTQYLTDQVDSCHRQMHDNIKIASNLDNPNRPGNEGGHPVGYYAGDQFYKETVIHELGHVVGSMADASQRTALAACFDRGPTSWLAGLNNEGAWEDRVTEGFAETFKDVFFPGRKFDNRTRVKLPQANFSRFLDILDKVCCCQPTAEES